MTILLPFFVGFLGAYIGLLAPGMLNMTAVQTSLEHGRAAGLKFAAGAASVVSVQSYLALTFAKFLIANPDVVDYLQIAAIFVLFGLSIFFFMHARKNIKAKGKSKGHRQFFSGMAMSSLNMLAIPFYLGVATIAEVEGWVQFKQPDIAAFVVGAMLGDFTLFATYTSFANVINKRATFIAVNINYILSGLFVVLGGIALVNVF